MDITFPKANLRNPGFTIEERKSFTKFLELGYYDTFRELHPDIIKYSFWSKYANSREKGRGLRADYFIVSEELFKEVIESDILQQYYGSDHCPVYMKINI